MYECVHGHAARARAAQTNSKKVDASFWGELSLRKIDQSPGGAVREGKGGSEQVLCAAWAHTSSVVGQREEAAGWEQEEGRGAQKKRNTK